MVSDCLNVNEKGNLTIGGADTVQTAKEFGTPLYVFDEATIRESCRSFKKSIDQYYDGNGLVLYASKAFACKEIYRIVGSEGLGTDVVSGGELYTALSVGFPAEKIFFHGNNKTLDEIQYAVKNDVGHIVVDNITELNTLNSVSAKNGKNVNVMLRIKPGIDAHTHNFIKTGQIDSKFGFALETGEALAGAKAAINLSNINLTGMHCHIGSQIFETEPFCLAAKTMIEFLKDIKTQTDVTLTELNLGGGFGIKYVESDTPRKYDEFMCEVSKSLKAKCKEIEFPVPKMFIEPGRSIIAPAGITLYTVGAIKNIPNVRTYVSIDGGMGDNPRYALYQAPYDVLIANKASQPKDFVATVAGKCCESGDLIQENAPIQTPEVGDTLAVLATGAYNYSMASNYNRIPRPAAVMIKDGIARMIIQRESYEDLVRNDI